MTTLNNIFKRKLFSKTAEYQLQNKLNPNMNSFKSVTKQKSSSNITLCTPIIPIHLPFVSKLKIPTTISIKFSCVHFSSIYQPDLKVNKATRFKRKAKHRKFLCGCKKYELVSFLQRLRTRFVQNTI